MIISPADFGLAAGEIPFDYEKEKRQTDRRPPLVGHSGMPFRIGG